MTVCERCKQEPERGSTYCIGTGETTYYSLCTKCGRKIVGPTRTVADEEWDRCNGGMA